MSGIMFLAAIASTLITGVVSLFMGLKADFEGDKLAAKVFIGYFILSTILIFITFCYGAFITN